MVVLDILVQEVQQDELMALKHLEVLVVEVKEEIIQVVLEQPDRQILALVEVVEECTIKEVVLVVPVEVD